MKHKKIIIGAIVTVIILVISYTASYYKTLTDEHQLTLKRNAIFKYLWENNYTSFSREFTEDIKRSHGLTSFNNYFTNSNSQPTRVVYSNTSLIIHCKVGCIWPWIIPLISLIVLFSLNLVLRSIKAVFKNLTSLVIRQCFTSVLNLSVELWD